MIAGSNITLIEGKNVITDEYDIMASQIFNKHNIYIVKKSRAENPNKIGIILGSLVFSYTCLVSISNKQKLLKLKSS